MGKPVWVRFVLVPGLTDDPDNIEKVARFVAPMTNVEWVEVLPFHQMGAFKWKTLGLDYQLADTPTPTDDAGAERRSRSSAAPAAARADRRRGRSLDVDFISDLIGTQPILALFLAIGARLRGRADQHLRLLARHRRRAVRRPGDRRHRAQGADRRADRPDRPDHVPLRHRHPVRPAVLRGPDRVRAHLQPARLRRRRSPGCWSRSGSGTSSACRSATPRHLRRLDDQHADAAGGARRDAATTTPSIGYSVAYPFGVIGPILCFYFLTRRGEADIPAEAGALPHGGDHHRAAARRRRDAGRGHRARCRPACRSPSVRQRARNSLPDDDIVLQPGDALLVVGRQARRPSARPPPRWAGSNRAASRKDRSDLSYQRFFVSKRA